MKKPIRFAFLLLIPLMVRAKQAQQQAPMTVTVPQNGNIVGITINQNDTNNNPNALTTNGNVTVKSLTCTGSPCGTGGGGGTNGSITAASRFQLPYYSQPGSTTTIAGSSITVDGVGGLTVPFGISASTISVNDLYFISPATALPEYHMKEPSSTATGIGFYDAGGSNVVAQSVVADTYGATIHGFAVRNGGSMRFYDSANNNTNHFTSFKASGTVASNLEYTLPSLGGGEGQVFTLHADSSTYWSTPTGSGSGGYAVQPATVAFNLAQGLQVTTVTATAFNSTTTSFTVTGSGGFAVISSSAGQISLTEGSSSTVTGIGAGTDTFWADSSSHTLMFNPNNTSTYTITGSSIVPVSGHVAQWSGLGKLIDGGIPVTINPGGSEGSFQYNHSGVFTGSTNTYITASSVTVISSFTVNTNDGTNIDNFTPGFFNVYFGKNYFVGKILAAFGSDGDRSQITFPVEQPAVFHDYGADLGDLRIGDSLAQDTIYDWAHVSSQNLINFFDATHGITLQTDSIVDGGGSIKLKPNLSLVVDISSSTGVTIVSSATVLGAGGIGATYGIAAATFTATSGVAFTQTYKAAVCQSGTASLGFSVFSTSAPTAACIVSTSTVMGIAPFVDTSSMSVQDHFTLPADWTGAVNANIVWTSSVTSNSVVWQIRTGCAASGSPAAITWNSFSTVTDAAVSPTSAINTASIAGISTSGCSAGNEMFFEFLRDPTHASDTLIATANLVTLQLSLRRTLSL